MFKKLISPSLLSSDFTNLKMEMKLLAEAGADWLHVDVMDGHFVPNLTLGMPIVASLKKHSSLPLDVHLMIEKPEKYLDAFIKAGSDILTLHIESTSCMTENIKHIQSAQVKAGITLKPKTDLKDIEPYLEAVDLVLVMTVEPGFGGQSFMMDQVSKIQQLKQWKDSGRGKYLIEVDGGINPHTAKICSDAGAEVFVAGNSIFCNGHDVESYRRNIQALRS